MKLLNKIFSNIVCLTCWVNSYAQQSILKQERSEKVRLDSVICYVNKYTAPESIPTLFKPAEIRIRREYNGNTSQDITLIRIQVNDTGHAVLKYLKYHASLLIRGRTFAHGIIPRGLSSAWISGLRYFESTEHSSDILEVLLFGEEHIPSEKIIHKTETKIIEYYDVDGRVLTRIEMQNLKLAYGSFREGRLLTGKEAAERYGDPKYSIGVQEVILIKINK